MIVKVCGMREAQNIRQIAALDIDWMGFVFYPPSPRYVSALPDFLPAHQKRVGVFVNATEDFIRQRAEAFGLDLIQLHGNETPDCCRELKGILGKPIIKAFGIDEKTDFARMRDYEGAADYFLFDTRCKAAGGSGRQFSHSLLQNYRLAIPFLLSGGLGPEDAAALRLQTPELKALGCIGFDLNSRFEESPALKSAAKLQRFLREIKQKP